MAQSIREIMTADARTVSSMATVADAAREMRDGDVGSPADIASEPPNN
jgi:CBS domain-containing protein